MYTAEQLLQPISGAEQGGIDLSFSSDFDAIAVARSFDDPSLDQGEWVTELKQADWAFVAQRCSALLAQKSKDLRLAVWLTEALAKQQTMRGLAEGLRLLTGLCVQFWDSGLYPRPEPGPDEARHEERIGNLRWLLARIPALVREMAPADAVGGAAPSSAPDSDCARQHVADTHLCLGALLELEQAADARLGIDSPGFSAAREALQALLPLSASKTDRLPDNASPEEDDAGIQDFLKAVPSTRAQAIAQLRLLAEFFRRTEPHSPASYFADKAADAGSGDLHSWLRCVVKDGASLAHIEELLGVRAPSSN